MQVRARDPRRAPRVSNRPAPPQRRPEASGLATASINQPPGASSAPTVARGRGSARHAAGVSRNTGLASHSPNASRARPRTVPRRAQNLGNSARPGPENSLRSTPPPCSRPGHVGERLTAPTGPAASPSTAHRETRVTLPAAAGPAPTGLGWKNRGPASVAVRRQTAATYPDPGAAQGRFPGCLSQRLAQTATHETLKGPPTRSPPRGWQFPKPTGHVHQPTIRPPVGTGPAINPVEQTVFSAGRAHPNQPRAHPPRPQVDRETLARPGMAGSLPRRPYAAILRSATSRGGRVPGWGDDTGILAFRSQGAW